MIVEIQKAAPALYVYWTLTDYCNFSCSYCPSQLHSGDFAQGRKSGYPSDSAIRTFLDRLVNVHTNGRFLQVTLSGGEPTVHPMFSEIVETLKPHGLIGIISNGSRPLNWWKKLPALPDRVTISLHAGFTVIEKINEVGEFLLDNNCEVAFNMMCDPEQWPDVQALYDKLTDRLKAVVNGKILTDHSFTAQMDGTPYLYSDEQLSYINSKRGSDSSIQQRFGDVDKRVYIINDDNTKRVMVHPFELSNAMQNQMQGWSCSAGRDGIAVSYNGNAYAGNCRVATLGRLDTFDLLTQDVTCTKKYCKTTADLPLPKHAPTWSPGR